MSVNDPLDLDEYRRRCRRHDRELDVDAYNPDEVMVVGVWVPEEDPVSAAVRILREGAVDLSWAPSPVPGPGGPPRRRRRRRVGRFGTHGRYGEPRRCHGRVGRGGRPCEARPMVGRDYCFGHDPVERAKPKTTCAGLRQDGLRCRNEVRSGAYCWMHTPTEWQGAQLSRRTPKSERHSAPEPKPELRPLRRVAEPFEGQCTGVTSRGKRCRLPGDGGNGRCCFHGG